MRLNKEYQVWEIRLKTFGEVVKYREAVAAKFLQFTDEETTIVARANYLMNLPYVMSVTVMPTDVLLDEAKLKEAIKLAPEDLETLVRYRVIVLALMKQVPINTLKTMQNIKIAFGNI